MSTIFGIWNTLSEMSDDLGVSYVTAAAMKRRGEIPSRYDLKVMLSAQRRGIEISLQSFAEWHDAHSARRRDIRQGGGDPEKDDRAFPDLKMTKPDKVEAAE